MRKGLFFSIEAMYLLVAVFVVVVALFYSLPMVEQPDYDFISALKVAHDMGQADTSSPPTISLPGPQSNYEFGARCLNAPVGEPQYDDSVAIIDYYDYEGLGKEVCMK